MQSSRDEKLAFPILIGDIGGTNARFAVVSDATSEPTFFPIVQTASFETIDAAIVATVHMNSDLHPRSAVLAVAGPVDGDEIALTNCPWIVRPRAMSATLGLQDIIVLNDFEAQALAVIAIGEEHMDRIGGGAAETGAPRVVLGPGTGLGVAGLIHFQDRWLPVPGEGGHMDIGPRSPRDLQIFPHLDPLEGRISGEQVLSGRGLVNIYNAIVTADGVAPRFATPAEVTAAALAGNDAGAKEALDLFVTYLGRTAGDLAMVFMSRGGVFLTGGIAQKIVPALKTGIFRAAFEDKAPHSAIMKELPVFVVTQPLAALAGLAAFGQTPERFGVATEGRRWRS